jgi:hypothetical protein
MSSNGAKARKSQQKASKWHPPMQEPIERSSQHWAAKAVQCDHGSLTAQGNSRRGSSTWVRQDCNIGGKHHGRALALESVHRLVFKKHKNIPFPPTISWKVLDPLHRHKI